LPAGFGVLDAKWSLFPIAGDLDSRWLHAESLQMPPGGLCAPLSKNEIVRSGSPFVAMAFDHNLVEGLRLHNSGIGSEAGSCIIPDGVLIEIEKNVR
jgi:hypothetical protein